MPQPAYPKAVKARAVERWLRGDKSLDIIDDVGCSPSALVLWTKGLKRERHPHRHSALVRARAVELYQRGFNSTACAQILDDGIAGNTVLKWVRQAGVEVRPSIWNRVRIDEKRAYALYIKHGTCKAARMMGCSRAGMRRAVIRYARTSARKKAA
jgi:transposase-like protein